MAIMLAMPAIAQDQDNSECFEQCSTKVTGLFTQRFFAALRKEESDGDNCLINEDAIGPYQISEEYYNESVKCRPSLRDGGKQFLPASIHIACMHIRSPACIHIMRLSMLSLP